MATVPQKGKPAPAKVVGGLTADLKERLEALGLSSANATVAKAALLEFLKQNDVEGVEEYDVKDLLEMADLFEPASAETTEDENEEVLEEEFEETNADEIEVEDQEYEDLSVESTIAKKPSKPIVKAPVAKATSANKGKVGRKATLEGEKWDGRNNKNHMKLIQPFIALFPPNKYEITVLKQGFTVRLLGKNTKPTILNFDELRITKEDGLVGNLYTNRFATKEELLEILPEEFHDKQIGMYRGESHPCIREMTEAEVIGILESTTFLKDSLKRAGDTDKRLGENRVKLEQQLSGKAAEEETEEATEEETEETEEEVEEEVAAPVAKKVQPVVKKVVAAPVKTGGSSVVKKPVASNAPTKGVMPAHLRIAMEKRKQEAAALAQKGSNGKPAAKK